MVSADDGVHLHGETWIGDAPELGCELLVEVPWQGGSGCVVTPAGQALRDGLRAVGVDAIYGEPLAGCPVVVVAGPVAPLFARAHRQVYGRRAAVHRGGRLYIDAPLGVGERDLGASPGAQHAPGPEGAPGQGPAAGPGGQRTPFRDGTSEPEPAAGPGVRRALEPGPSQGSGPAWARGEWRQARSSSGATRPPNRTPVRGEPREPGSSAARGAASAVGPGAVDIVPVRSADDFVDALGQVASLPVELRLELDLSEPVERPSLDLLPEARGWPEPPDDLVERLHAARAPVVLAGPGLVHQSAAAGLHAVAVAGSLGVLNTWGAKGVLHWRSRHHWATVGLQAWDFELGGLAEADLIVATGVDLREAPPERWQLAPVVELEPAGLAPLAEALRRPPQDLAMPPLRTRLATATQAGWARAGTPLAPSRATLNYAQAIGAGGLVAADPGLAGYWVARTYGTTETGSVHVPADAPAVGLAAACVAVARLWRPGRAALAVVDGPAHPVVHEVVEAALALGVGVPVEVWGAGGERLDPDAHLARAARIAHDDAASLVSLELDDRQLTTMLDAAGPIVAWPELRLGEGR